MNARFQDLPVLAMVGVVALLCAPQANATVEITLTNGASSITVADGSAQDSCLQANCVTYIGSLGNYVINVSTGIAQSGTNPFMDLASVNVALGPNAGALMIAISQNGYTASHSQFSLAVGGTGGLGGLTSFAAYGGNTNVLFDTSNQLGSTLTFPSSAFSGTTLSSSGNTINPYSLTVVATLNGVAAGATSFNAALNAMPEPVSVSLLGAVLLFSASAIRRKLRQTA